MPNILDETGLQVATVTELINQLTSGFKVIYGEDLNIDQNTPDGQLINILAQAMADFGELILDINAGFDPDQAVGVILDQRVKLNGLIREKGAYSRVNVSVIFDGSAVLKGLDVYNAEECFQVSDSSGNVLINEVTTTGVNGEVLTLSFRAQNFGALVFPVNSITTINTPLLGVASVVNNTPQYETGRDEETDVMLKTRRARIANSKSRFGGVDALYNELMNVQGVTFVNVLENTTDSVYNGIPAHGIWIIADGAYENTNVAKAIYAKRIMGTPMKGSITATTPRPDGTLFTSRWDRPVVLPLYIKMSAQMIEGSLDENNVRLVITENLILKPGEAVDTTRIKTLLKSHIIDIIVTDLQVSKDGIIWFQDLVQVEGNERLQTQSNYITFM